MKNLSILYNKMQKNKMDVISCLIRKRSEKMTETENRVRALISTNKYKLRNK